MKFSMTVQENGDLLIQVTAWEGLTIWWLHGQFWLYLVSGFNVACGIWGEDFKIDKCKETQGSQKMQVNSNINFKKKFTKYTYMPHLTSI
jgi:hypothetical protein